MKHCFAIVQVKKQWYALYVLFLMTFLFHPINICILYLKRVFFFVHVIRYLTSLSDQMR